MAEIDLSRWIRPGDTVWCGQGDATPRALLSALLDQRHQLKPLRLILGIGAAGLVQPVHADVIEFVSYGALGTNRSLAQAGVLDILPAHYGQLPAMLRTGALRADVVLLQVAPCNTGGLHSFGLEMDYLPAACESARVVIGEVNDQVPWTHGEQALRATDFSTTIRVSYPVEQPPVSEPTTPEAIRIAQRVADLIDDGMTLQIGVGAIPEAALTQLQGRRDLGLHSGVATDGIAALAEAGVLTNARKNLDKGVGITGLLLGGGRLRRYVERNPAIELRGLDYTHSPSILAQIDRLAAINSAIEVDLSGQVNAEIAAGRYVGAVGGAPAFLQGAQVSRGGKPIVALPATAGDRSRIVSALGGPVSTARSDAGYVVTEYGTADLRGATLTQRLRRMLDIAAPQFREPLAREAQVAMRSAGIHWTQRMGS